MLDEALHAPEAGGASEHARARRDCHRRARIATHAHRYHRAEARHLPQRERMAWIVREPRVADPFNAGMTVQEFRNLESTGGLGADAKRQRRETAPNQPAVEG